MPAPLCVYKKNLLVPPPPHLLLSTSKTWPCLTCSSFLMPQKSIFFKDFCVIIKNLLFFKLFSWKIA